MTSDLHHLAHLRGVRRLTWVAVFPIVLLSCGGAEEPTPPPSVARIQLSEAALSLVVGESRAITAVAFDARGAVIPGAVLTWRSSNVAVATVAASGVLSAAGVGAATVLAASGAVTASVQVEVTPVRVARVALTAGTGELLNGGTLTARYTVSDAAGAEISGWTPQWSLSDSTVARVDAVGTLTGLRAGSTTLRLRVDTATADQAIRVHGSLDIRVAGLTFAQVVQNDSGTVPMIRGGGLAVVANVFVTANAAVVPRTWVRVRCGQGSVTRWEDSVRVDVALDSVPKADAPAVQLLMPNARLAPSMECVALADASPLAPDSVPANNRFPRLGERAVSALDVPPLEITFVPIVLAADGGVTGNVTEGNLDQYLITARQMLPLAQINPRVGAALTTTTLFAGGADAAWRAILRELDSKRMLDQYRGHYYGVVRPAAGVVFVQFGGFGFVAGRTAVSIQVGWFSREAQARETVAHELGHNFGRPHAPCGGPASPDPSYPYPDAVIGARGWDVYNTPTFGPIRVSAVSSETRDLMSYCRPIWISDYTYVRMIAGRQALAAATSGTAAGNGVLVRGEVDEALVTIDPLFAVDQGPSTQAMEGVDLEVLDAEGRVIARHRSALLVPDHGGPRSFVAVVPTGVGSEPRAVRVRLPGNTAQATRRFDSGAGHVAVDIARRAGATTIRWDSARSPHILIRDDVTGEVLAFAQGGHVDVPTTGRGLRMSFSNGSRGRVLR